MKANPPRTILITGASKGLGRAVADYLAQQGHQIIGVARNLPQKPFPGEFLVVLQKLSQTPNTEFYYAVSTPQIVLLQFFATEPEKSYPRPDPNHTLLKEKLSMSLEQNKAIVLQFYKAFGQGNLEQMKEMVAPNFVVHGLGPDVLSGDDFFEHLQMTRSTFPDSYHTIEDVIAEADKVVSHGTFRGTHHRAFLGIPPTGKQVKFSIVQVDQLADGKIVEHRTIGDSLTMLQQLRGENLV